LAVIASRERYAATVKARCQDVDALTERTNKLAVLVVQQFPVASDAELLCPPVRESIATIMMFVELGTPDDLLWVLDETRETCRMVAVDCDQKLATSEAIVAQARAHIAPERLLLYSDNQAWFDSSLDMIQRIEQGVTARTVLLCGTGPLAEQMTYTLPRLGARVLQPHLADGLDEVRIVVGASQKTASIDEALIARLAPETAVYDIGIGNLTAGAADLARARQMRVYRLDNRAGISSVVVRLLETDYMVSKLMGHVRVRDVDIVAGGLLAPAGAVIVDDIRHPTVILGVADGRGLFRRPPLSPEDQARIDFVSSLTVNASRQRGHTDRDR
jgi:hypothetical protein